MTGDLTNGVKDSWSVRRSAEMCLPYVLRLTTASPKLVPMDAFAVMALRVPLALPLRSTYDIWSKSMLAGSFTPNASMRGRTNAVVTCALLTAACHALGFFILLTSPLALMYMPSDVVLMVSEGMLTLVPVALKSALRLMLSLTFDSVGTMNAMSRGDMSPAI